VSEAEREAKEGAVEEERARASAADEEQYQAAAAKAATAAAAAAAEAHRQAAREAAKTAWVRLYDLTGGCFTQPLCGKGRAQRGGGGAPAAAVLVADVLTCEVAVLAASLGS
jgi:membrane protein involved in colicin uptake